MLVNHSLAPLRQLPVDGVKLDRTLVGEIDGPEGVDALAAVRVLCELGAALDLGVVAEGVERTEQVVLLTEAGCAVAQGVLLGVPRSVAELGPELGAGELGPVEPRAAAPALADLVDLAGDAEAAAGTIPLDAAEVRAGEGTVVVPSRRVPGPPVPVPISGVRPDDLRRMLDRSR